MNPYGAVISMGIAYLRGLPVGRYVHQLVVGMDGE